MQTHLNVITKSDTFSMLLKIICVIQTKSGIISKKIDGWINSLLYYMHMDSWGVLWELIKY